MSEVGRNDLCPCGSGRKHKRCCLEIHQTAQRVAAAAEARLLELGDIVRDEAPEQWRRAYEERLVPLNRHGLLLAEMAAWLDTWLVCDGPIVDGRTPLVAYGAEDPHPVDEQLLRSSISGWWLRGDDWPSPAVAWNREEPLVVHCRHKPLGALGEGALLVGRGVEVGAAAVALVARPVIVDAEAVHDVLAVLASSPADALCAALRWPEVREHTADGELVQQCYRTHELPDRDAALAALRAWPPASEQDLLGLFEDDVTFYVRGHPTPARRQPPPERGVTWELCVEDCEEPPRLGEVTVSPADGQLLLSAPTRGRVDQLVAALPPQITASLGAPISEDLDQPDVLCRVSRDQLEVAAAPM